MDDFISQFGERLRELRKRRNLTQAALAGKLGVVTLTVSAWETGRRAPTLEHIGKLCRVLSCTPSHLLPTPVERAKDGMVSWVEGVPVGLPESQQAFLEAGVRAFRFFMKGYTFDNFRSDEILRAYPEASLYNLLAGVFRAGCLRIIEALRDREREQALELRFPHLAPVVVAAIPSTALSVIKAEIISFLAANHILPTLRNPSVIGFGPGYTITRLAEQSIPTETEFSKTRWVSLVAYPRRYHNLELQSANCIVRTMGTRHVQSSMCLLPFMARDDEGRPIPDDPGGERQYELEDFQKVDNAWREMSAAFVTVGYLGGGTSDGRIFPLQTLSPYIEERTCAEKVAGEFLGLYLDDRGEMADDADVIRENRAMAFQIDLRLLREVTNRGHVYLLAAGGEKARAAAMVVRSGFANRLVIDCDIADYLLEGTW